MIDPEPYRIVWEKKFTRDISDIFTLKNEIGQTVLSSLNIRLTTHQKERLTRKPTNNLEAYNLYQQGRSYTFSASQRRLGNELLRQAIEIDPGFYNAYAALAYSHATAVSFGQSLDKDKELDTAFRLATKAVAMNHQSAEANVALAIAFLLRGKHEESLDAAGRAMEANPGYAAGHGIHGWILTMSGNPSQALASFSQAVRLQPTSNGVVLGVYGATYYMAGRYEEALAILEESITLNPNLLTSHAFLAATYQRLNQPDDAAWEAEEVIALNPDFKITQWRWIETYKNKDDPPLLGLREDLQKAGLAL